MEEYFELISKMKVIQSIKNSSSNSTFSLSSKSYILYPCYLCYITVFRQIVWGHREAHKSWGQNMFMVSDKLLFKLVCFWCAATQVALVNIGFWPVIINSVAEAVTLMDKRKDRDGRVPCLNLGSQPACCCCCCSKFFSKLHVGQSTPQWCCYRIMWVILGASSACTDTLL